METMRSTWMRWVPSATECSNPRCHQSNRLLFWRRQRGAWIQGHWFCADQCLELEIEQVVQRILSKQHSLTRTPHRMPLGLLMLSRGFLNKDQLQTALLKQRHGPSDKIGQCLQRLGYVTERQVVAALALQWGTPVLAFPEEIAPENAVPSELLDALRIMPVRLSPTQGTLYVAFSDPVDHGVLRAIEQMTGWNTSPCIVSDRVMDQLLSKMHSCERDSTHTFENVSEPTEIGRLGASEIKVAECGAYIWARLKDGSRDSDILFRVSPAGRIEGRRSTAPEPVPQSFR
jgi:Type II secretion system (T2SS), protein E, N-terminal domain